jgi:glycerol kinase
MYILSIDQGTTSSRCVIYDLKANVVAQASKEFKQHFRHPGWVEHDAIEIFQTVLDTFHQVIKLANIESNQIKTIGITNQRETTVLWDKSTGLPVAPAIVWQSRQSSKICDRIRAAGHLESIRSKTGLLPDPYFSASKLTWLFEEHPEIQQNPNLAFGTIDSWLLWKLSAGAVHATDISNASRTMLFNISTCTWDDDLLSLFKIPKFILPKVLENTAHFGNTDASITGNSIPINAMAGDQQAALFGQACFQVGMAKNTYGTGCFMLMQTGDKLVESKHGLLTTIAWKINGKLSYALEGSVFVAGSAVQWLRDGIQLLNDASETEELARSVDDTDGVYFVPAFVGLGAPYWDSDARGAFFGITRGTNRAHIVRATLEAMAFQTRDVFELMQQESDISLKTLRVDGGAAANNLMMQFQSDVLGVDVDRPNVVETTALGVAMMAGLSAGIWSTLDECAALRVPDAIFHPAQSSAQTEKQYKSWKRAVKATMSFHE